MLRPYDLLENVLLDIERGIREGINLKTLAEKYSLSEGHLRRLFRFAFKQTIAGYIRSRRLSASLDDLLKTDSKLINIALEYGFEYEQTYLRAFKREFGITPGNLRKAGHIVKVKPPFHLFDENRLSEGLLFGPDIVMVPQFHIIGKLHRIPDSDSITLAPEVGKSFWYNERNEIKTAISSDVYIGLTRKNDNDIGFSEYLTAVQVENFKKMPEGFSRDTFGPSLCAKFRYIGQHHYSEINRNIAGKMYEAIKKFTQSEQSQYTLLNDEVYFERIDTRLYDGTYCQMEWYAPVAEKMYKCLSRVNLTDKEWLEQIAVSIEAKYGVETRNRIFGDLHTVSDDHVSVCEFFHKFILEMDRLDDRDFLTSVMAECCPCYHCELEENIKKNYAQSRTLEEFARRLDEDGIFDDAIKLEGNILIATKRPFTQHGKHDHTGPFAKTCHCTLASHAKQKVSDIFCHCCTVGFYGKMFRNALNHQDIKVEFVDSVITGGKGCTAAIYLPEKGK